MTEEIRTHQEGVSQVGPGHRSAPREALRRLARAGRGETARDRAERPAAEPAGHRRSAAIVLVVTALFSLTIALTVTRSVAESKAFAERIAAGDRRSRLVPVGRNEFFSLATALNTMAESLHEADVDPAGLRRRAAGVRGEVPVVRRDQHRLDLGDRPRGEAHLLEQSGSRHSRHRAGGSAGAGRLRAAPPRGCAPGQGGVRRKRVHRRRVAGGRVAVASPGRDLPVGRIQRGGRRRTRGARSSASGAPTATSPSGGGWRPS